MNAVPSTTGRDAALEAEIDATYELMITATTDEASKAYWRDMVSLIYKRSPVQIQKMEFERRLAIKRARV